MPRVDLGAAAGLRVPGVYDALFQLERRRNERDDRCAARMMAAEGFCYRRGRLLAERLEAGESVLVDCAQVELALWDRDRDGPAGRVRLPFGRAVRFARVNLDDTILPAESTAL